MCDALESIRSSILDDGGQINDKLFLNSGIYLNRTRDRVDRPRTSEVDKDDLYPLYFIEYIALDFVDIRLMLLIIVKTL